MQPGSKNPPFLPAPEMCAHTRGLAFGTSCSHPAQPCPAQRATVPGPCGRAQPRGHMSEAQGQALLAHSCSRPQTKGISRHGQHGVCGSSSRARERGTALPPAPALLLGRDSTGTAQGHSSAPRTSSGAGCPRDQTLSPPAPTGMAAQAAHQFSLLMWSPKPGVSMTVSFMRTPFSSISAMRRKQLCEAAPENTCRSGLAPPPGKKSAFTAFPGTNQPSRELSTTSALKLSPPPPTPPCSPSSLGQC